MPARRSSVEPGGMHGARASKSKVRFSKSKESAMAWYLYDKYQQERWTISHFDDGGFDLDPEPDEWDYRDHLRDLRDISDFQ